ncbi:MULTISPECIES: site-specific integrase [unclassified Ruegeria]|uniref:tyrosine-type recombinase/integrase n=1 Tax=unclassified Ruegeria TaxID=2625375 RepID=UPI0014923700|nr:MULTISPECIES: site-specific integrase [unclassified Ruegeria]NOD87406.1 integrase arm-type DNA-binding domain-containing protein [Ruegeria sp. HKCCD4318]NOE12961.1 integrase arm-type DNA-binding domain-containing protein [Ruegeria sp. HKCCD4318-2]NOG08872.1 integrase arm-type DNA-binding domain-containing protein [Ruegeria sp. HKCCD4315]
MRQTQLNKLTARQVQHAKPGKHSDGGGLWLVVSPTGTRKWVLRHTVDGKRRERGLGGYPAVSVADARAKAAAVRSGDKMSLEKSPSQNGKATFRSAMDRYLTLRGAEWSNSKHAKQWPSTLRTYAGSLMDMPVDAIRTADVAGCLIPIWQTKPETASRVRQRIERILSASIAMGERDGPNPAALRDNLELVLGKQVKTVRHHPAIPVADLPDAFATIWHKRDTGAGTMGLVLVFLTVLRSGEVRHMEWSDVGSDVVTIPADRMKARRGHRTPVVPLLGQVLDDLPRWSGTSLVVPGQSNRPMSDATMAAALRRAGMGAYTPHGIRSSFSDWANESGYPHRHIEDQLAHQIGTDVERAYRRGDYLTQRVPMMEDWTKMLTSRLNI